MATWNQAAPPPSGVTYEWAGEPHNSESIKRVDGQEVARNHVNNPSYEGPLAGFGIWEGEFAVTSSFPGGFWASGGVSGSNILHAESLGTNYIITFFTTTDGYAPVPAGSTHGAIRAQVAHDSPPNIAMDARIGVIYRTPTGLVYVESEFVSAPAWGGREITFTHTIPSGATEVGYRVQWRSRDSAQAVPEGTRLFAEKIHVSISDTEAGALAQVEEYFDGSFEDDREGDIWVNSSTGAFYSWGGASRGWVSRNDDKANHPLSDNRLDTSYLVNPVHAGSAEPHQVYMSSSGWSHPDGDDARAYMDIYADETYPMVLPAVRLVLTEGTSKLGDGRDLVAGLRPEPGGQWNAGAISTQHIRVTPGEEVAFRLRVNYSWQDTLMYRDRGIVAGIAFADSAGSWISSHYSDPVPANRILDRGALLEQVATVPERAAWAYTLISVDAPPQTRTGNGSLYMTDFYFGTTDPPRSGASEVGVATVDRRGLVSETFARSREKINLQLAEPDERLKGGERIELAAFAASSSEVTWRWRQVTGPEVFLVREGNTCYFQAPDVDTLTDMRIAVSASSVDGANRSDWHYFDLEIRPAAGRFAAEGSDGFEPYTPQMVGYNRGKREIWNDVIAPVGMDPEGRKEPKLVDLGIPADDVTFSLDGEEPARASAGAVYVDIQDGAIYRNFGGGYNETDDTTGAPRLNAYMVNPATGEVFEWEEGSDDGR